MDLFSAPLEKVIWKDLESFLGLTLPEDQRLREGERIDFKEQFPQDLGEIVAGLSNTSGGLIFLGIKSDKKKHNVPVAWDGIPTQSDLETRATAKILSTVRPKPSFKVHAVSIKSDRVILIVRVGEGNYPPYEYEQGNTVKIPTRVNDTLRQANVREIEALLKKRSESAPLSELAILQYINAPGFDCTNSNGIQDTEFQRIVIIPRKKAWLRLDSNFERDFEIRVLSHFQLEQNVTMSTRRGEYLQFQSRLVSPQVSWHHLWRAYENGALGFTGSLCGDFPNGKPIGDLALDLLSMCRLSENFYRANDIEGDVYLAQFLRASSAKFLAKFPILPGHDYCTSDGVIIPASGEQSADRTIYYRLLQQSDLAEPYAAIAEILMYNLREIRQIRIDYARFLSQITQLKPLPLKHG